MKTNNRIAVFLGHPAHYHMFKYVTENLEQKGFEIDFLVKRKDILEELVKRSGHRYFIVRSREREAGGKLRLAMALIFMELKVIRYLLRFRPRLLIGTYAPVISHLTGVPMIVCCEDDASIVPRFAKTSYPYASAILVPQCCNGGAWDAKMTKYDGYQKLAYLHPNRFVPSREIVTPYLRDPQRPYVLMRFAKLKAHHDDGIGGIDNALALNLVQRLSSRYDVFISSERPLPEELEPYRLAINPLDIHHWLAFATIYLGDSQSMSVEAAMLGVPSIRFSDFAGRIGVLEELEHRYQLTFGIPSDEPERLIAKVDELLEMPSLEAVFQQRRKRMLAEKIDVTGFFTWFIENYPESQKTMKENPNYQFEFK